MAVLRFKSLRAYRRMVDERLAQARRGEISWSEANSAVAALRGAAEMLMAENILKLEGVSGVEDTEKGEDEDGGLEYRPDDRAKVFRRKRIVVRRGLDAKGNKVDLTEVVEEGSALDDDWDIDWEKDPDPHGEQA